MSVLARLRSTAPTEFEMNCERLVKYTVGRMDSLPNRYKKFVRPKIMTPLMGAYHDVIIANETSWKSENGRKERVQLFERALRRLSMLQRPLVVYWNLKNTKQGGIDEWVNLINREIALINGAAKRKEGDPVLYIRSYQMAYSDDHIFLNRMRDLHKYTYSKICTVPLEYKDHLSDAILKYVDDALYLVLEGNRSIPTSKAEYERRDKCFRQAVSNLNGLQRPLYSLWNVMNYSENVMDEWACAIDEEILLIQGVRKSDRERFRHLK